MYRSPVPIYRSTLAHVRRSPMRPFSSRPSVVLCLLMTCLALPGVAQAQQPTQDLVSFKATIKGAFPAPFVVPLNPPVAVFAVTWTGDADYLGPVTYVES